MSVARKLLKQKTARDKQTLAGPSSLGSACDACVAHALSNTDEGDPYYWVGASIGTAVHEMLDRRARRHRNVLREHKVSIGDIPGYGTIRGSTDRFEIKTGTVRDFKGLSIDTPLPTPTGWTTMGEVSVGELLFDEQGRPTRVTAKSEVHYKKCYRVTFDDGTSVVADFDHRWRVRQSGGVRQQVLTTEELVGGRWCVDVAKPLLLPEQTLPVDPYVLGVWLGDGESNGGRITTGNTKTRVIDEIHSRGYQTSEDHARNDPTHTGQTRTVYGLCTQLRSLGVLGNKHIPMSYLRASTAQRLLLLQGLMDTDGYFNVKRRTVDASTTSIWQSQGVAELVRSLGSKAYEWKGQTAWQGGETTMYRVSFNMDHTGMRPFLRRNETAKFSRSLGWRARIVSVVEVPTVPTQCVAVDSPNRLYLCGQNMIPTHNTTLKKHVPSLKNAYRGNLETLVAKEADVKLSGYLGQGHLYGKALVEEGYDVKLIALDFICRDGSTDEDIFEFTYPYSQKFADAVWERVLYIHANLATETFHSNPHCIGCALR